MNKKKLSFISLVVLLAYFLCWPVAIEPQSWVAPQAKGYVGVFTPNTRLAALREISLKPNHGPEALAINQQGHVFVATHEGWLMRQVSAKARFENWVQTGGRPLGLAFDPLGNLIVADAFRGLLQIKPDGSITVLVDSFESEPLVYVNDLDIAADGRIFFSDSSSRHSARALQSTLAASLLDIIEHAGNGRLFVYDPRSQKTELLMAGLNFANGVALAKDAHFVLVNETGTYRVHKYWLEGARAGQSTVIVDNLPGFPDNLSRGLDGRFWLGLTSPRNALIDKLSEQVLMRKVVQRLPAFIRPQAVSYGHILAISEEGDVLHSLQDPSGNFPLTTGALEVESGLYVSSLTAPSLGFLKAPLAGWSPDSRDKSLP